MNIEEAIKEVAARALPEMAFCLGTWHEIDEQLDLLKPPYIWVVFPRNGAVVVHRGRYIERLTALVGFFDLAPRDANGEDNMNVYRRMYEKALIFIDAANKSGHFKQLNGNIEMDVFPEVGAAYVTGLMLTINFEEITGVCL